MENECKCCLPDIVSGLCPFFVLLSLNGMIRRTNILLVLLLLWAAGVHAQATFTVDQFSKTYYGKIFIADTAAVFSSGWVAIYDRSNNKELLKVQSDELALSLHEGQAVANIKELPYGEQSIIMYEDYNFDGIKDLAIEDGQNSCYHGPSFQVYLGLKSGFAYSTEFTRLGQEYCGMFQVDDQKKRLYASTKSGCCWHQFSEFTVEGNRPRAVKIVEEDFSGGAYPYGVVTEKIWDGRKMISSSKTILSIDEGNGVKEILSFRAAKNGKKMILFTTSEGRALDYALLDKEEAVEFSYPEEDGAGRFDYHKAGNTLVFKNRNATYTIYCKKDSAGILVDVGGKHYDWTADPATIKGDLSSLGVAAPENVVVH